RVAAVRAALAATSGQAPSAVEFRVAASVMYLGLVARLLSPTLAVAVISDGLLEFDLGNTWWQPVLGAPFPLSVPREADTNATDHHLKPENLAGLLANRVVDGPIRELLQATITLSVSPRTLWGNVASAVNGAAAMIATSRPTSTDQSRLIA